MRRTSETNKTIEPFEYKTQIGESNSNENVKKIQTTNKEEKETYDPLIHADTPTVKRIGEINSEKSYDIFFAYDIVYSS